MATSIESRPGVLAQIVNLASPSFIVLAIVLPIGAYLYAFNFGPIRFQNYVHILTGGLWTGIDLFMGFVLGPVLGGMAPKDRAGVFKNLIPRMAVLMPVLAMVAGTSGFQLAERLQMLSLSNPWVLASLIITGLLALQGFGILLPNEIRIFKQLVSETPDIQKIARLGMQNARFSGIQGLLQLAVIFTMASLRF